QGWNSEDMAVLEQPEFAALRYAIRAACASALAEMGQGERAFDLQSWVNLHDRGGFNFLHMHEGSLLSGSFYLQVPPGSGEFVFRDPRPGVLHGFIKGGVPNGHADIHLTPDRKSTRLNSSHQIISYAVFCLKKKMKKLY